ncbi:unnamed protein product [Ostreobium quekettii]|uniref:Uncharacterized protein n=1 Tax=Ostreobium quekettii TaxID=121088 RepID=A0A8S1IPX0_9CHLO|nr:unnamed protein product [Ostreobium quekettii]
MRCPRPNGAHCKHIQNTNFNCLMANICQYLQVQFSPSPPTRPPNAPLQPPTVPQSSWPQARPQEPMRHLSNYIAKECKADDNTSLETEDVSIVAFSDLIWQYADSVARSAQKVMRCKNRSTLVPEDVGSVVWQGDGINIPGCTPGAVVSLGKTSAPPAIHSQRLAAARRTNAQVTKP